MGILDALVWPGARRDESAGLDSGDVQSNAGQEYQPGWSADRVTLPDKPAGILSPIMKSQAPWSLKDSALNALFDTHEIHEMVKNRASADPKQGSQWWQSRSPAKPDWVRLPQPNELEAGEHGSGYYTYGTDPSDKPGTGPNGQWGEPRTMATIAAVADRLAVGKEYTPFGVGNISLPDGGKFKGHDTHTDGLGIDVRAPRLDGAELPSSYTSNSYDRAAAQRLIDAFIATGQVEKIYFNDQNIRGVSPWKNHDNHFHVELKR